MGRRSRRGASQHGTAAGPAHPAAARSGAGPASHGAPRAAASERPLGPRDLLRHPSIVLVLGLLAAPLAAQVLGLGPDQAASQRFERREYAARPSLRLDASLTSFPRDFERWYDDSFGLRLPLVRLNAALAYRVFNISPNRSLLIGEDGWFFGGYGRERVQGGVVRPFDNIADYLGQNPYTPAELARWQRALEARYWWLRERGIPYAFAFAPAKHMIYPEHLPAQLRLLKRQTRMEQLIAHLRAHSVVPVIDLVPALTAAKAERPHPHLYYKTDGHWNYYGALHAYRGVLEAVRPLLSPALASALRLTGLDDYELRWVPDWSHSAFTGQLGMQIIDEYPNLLPLPDLPLADLWLELRGDKNYQVGPQAAAVPPFKHAAASGAGGPGMMLPFADLTDRAGVARPYNVIDLPRGGPLDGLVLIGDSFLEKLVYYFSNHARRTVFYRELLGFPTHIFDVPELRPQLVVQEMVQTYLFKDAPSNPPEVDAAWRPAAP